jgi:aminobenzoyl-glutamate transport protein
MIASTVMLTFVGWGVSARFVEPRMSRVSADMGGPPASHAVTGHNGLDPMEKRGLRVAGLALAAMFALIFAAVVIPGAPLHGKGTNHARWIEAIVPLLFFVFLVPGMAYGIATGTIRSDRDVAKLMGRTMADMGPYIVLAFFAAQFVEYFKYSNLGVMLAIKGGQALAAADLPPWALLVVFIAMVMCINILIASASAKFAFVAPVFVPMLMQVGISPELTQAAYRVGDSVTNIVTPLNSYLILILVVMQKYAPRAGVGTLVALMLPFSLVFWIVWTLMLVAWVQLGIPLGPEGPLWYGR